MDKEKIIVYTDGGSRGNPGPSAVGGVVKNHGEVLIKKYSKEIGERTNNETEYEAVVLALQKIKQLFGKEKAKDMEIEIRMKEFEKEMEKFKREMDKLKKELRKDTIQVKSKKPVEV